MKNIYVVRKYVLANSAKQAMEKERKTPVHDCWLEENSQKRMLESMENIDKKKAGIKTK
jgi:hypothetical protein